MTTDEVDPPLDERTTQRIPVLNVRAGPRDGGEWIKRLKEEYTALIHFVKMNKEADGDWFTIASDSTGTRWTGTCWTFHDGLRYEFGLTFDIPATYPVTHPEICVPDLDGKTAKMYRGGKICLTGHFAPLWQRNVPRFGIAHAMALGLAPWLAAEVPDLIERGMITPV
ncbi:hypothetical protein, variant 1 [Aphanomyces astaci]|uniref:Ubiquitin-fold modifier-conjugating enzyme 1 n=1 Tax=Aphanomyces astaci TaxID=112090 RepID=W4GRC1_APHAT|nr:hypothetical protein, variant 1 [Aphanomyces astaci]ETV82270.1 hypothetical protein, variant 1 [Aphanomyces astaci]|eukprot:XP_009827939.1 hypothetical protein, variant 1 [Aphanomyces astaci]